MVTGMEVSSSYTLSFNSTGASNYFRILNAASTYNYSGSTYVSIVTGYNEISLTTSTSIGGGGLYIGSLPGGAVTIDDVVLIKN